MKASNFIFVNSSSAVRSNPRCNPIIIARNRNGWERASNAPFDDILKPSSFITSPQKFWNFLSTRARFHKSIIIFTILQRISSALTYMFDGFVRFDQLERHRRFGWMIWSSWTNWRAYVGACKQESSGVARVEIKRGQHRETTYGVCTHKIRKNFVCVIKLVECCSNTWGMLWSVFSNCCIPRSTS